MPIYPTVPAPQLTIPAVGLAGQQDSAVSNPLRQRAVKVLDSLPPFSPVMNHLLKSLSDEDVPFAKLAGLLEKDTVLAGRILQLVNSAAFGRRDPVNSLQRAVALLGFHKLRNTVLCMSVGRIWGQSRTPQGWSTAAFNLHSTAVAVMSDALAQNISVEFPESAFVAGLLHDVGRLMIAVGLPEEYFQIQQLLQQPAGSSPDLNRPKTIEECEQVVLGFTHADISADALTVWKLPASIQQAGGDHHMEANHSPSQSPIRLNRLISVANEVVNLILPQAGESAADGRASTEAQPDAAYSHLATLGISPADGEAICNDFRAEIQRTAEFFQ